MSRRPARILIVDDDHVVADSMIGLLARLGYEADAVHSIGAGIERLNDAAAATPDRPAHPYAVMICDISLPDGDGLELARVVRREHPAVVPIMVTGYGTIEAAVRAIRMGAIDYLTKPIVDEELAVAVEKAVQQHLLVAENVTLRHQLDARYGLGNIVGTDARMCRIYDVVEAVAASKTTVLMRGESGTGKSLVARAIHQNSPRSDQPFVEIACGSIPETLLESELFGHIKGAFTGAHTDKPGRFLAAHGGTLFLDEINSASPGMQLKLLRVLQERCFEPVGSTETVEVDVRIVLATNQPLEDLVAEGTFRQDLYYRINVVSIQLPPLRDRIADIPLLAEHFLARKGAEAGRQVVGFTPEAMDVLKGYDYPGNVRELENIVERAVVLTRSPTIGVDDLPPEIVDGRPSRLGVVVNETTWVEMTLRDALDGQERQIILAALQANDWSRQATAEALGINRTTLYKKIKQHGLEQLGETG